MHKFATLAAIAASVSMASATGTAYIKNYCSVAVNLWPVDALRNPSGPTSIPAGATYSEPYHVLTSGGVSLKLSKNSTLAAGEGITQFEYTLLGGFIWYDGSNVNCDVTNCPFYSDGVYMDTSDPSCPTRTCLPNQKCTGFYNAFNDDVNSLACGPSADITMYLCATSPNGPAGIAAPASSAAAPAAASSSPAAHASPVRNLVASVSSAVAPSDTAIYRMEALHVPATTLKKVSAREVNHAHMRRHAHGHQH